MEKNGLDFISRLDKFKLELPQDSLFALKSATSKDLNELLKIAEVTGGIIYEHTPVIVDVEKEEGVCGVCGTSYYLPGNRPSGWCADCDAIGGSIQTTEKMTVYHWQKIEQKEMSTKINNIINELGHIKNEYGLLMKKDEQIKYLEAKISNLCQEKLEIEDQLKKERKNRQSILQEVYPRRFNLGYFLSKYGEYLLNNPNGKNKNDWKNDKSRPE